MPTEQELDNFLVKVKRMVETACDRHAADFGERPRVEWLKSGWKLHWADGTVDEYEYGIEGIAKA